MDLKQIKTLAELMVEHDLSRVEIQDGDSMILLRRGHAPIVSAAPPQYAAALAPPPAASAPVPAEQSAASAAADNELVVRSPMVGTFYSSPDPESPPFVNVGDTIGPETVVCLVEAMKVFNEIKAECSGRITNVLVKNASAVEYDQPLFAVAPT